jgi:class 3 adenylate cyclase
MLYVPDFRNEAPDEGQVGYDIAATEPPRSQVAEVAAAGLVEAHDVPDGERKTVTALFADIKGSTELMEDLDPEDARAIIDPALKLMIEAVRRYDGYVVQSTGDPAGTPNTPRSVMRRTSRRGCRRRRRQAASSSVMIPAVWSKATSNCATWGRRKSRALASQSKFLRWLARGRYEAISS